MQQKKHQPIVISAVLTTLILSLIGGGLLFSNGVLPLNRANAADAVNQITPAAPIVVTVQPVIVPDAEWVSMSPSAQESNANDLSATVPTTDTVAATSETDARADSEIVAVYQAQLDEAYKALEEAYVQIDLLQSAQSQTATTAYHDDDDEHEGSHNERNEERRGKQERDDD